MFFQSLNVEGGRLADGERDSYSKSVSLINFFCGLFFEGVYNMPQIKAAEVSDPILLYF